MILDTVAVSSRTSMRYTLFSHLHETEITRSYEHVEQLPTNRIPVLPNEITWEIIGLCGECVSNTWVIHRLILS